MSNSSSKFPSSLRCNKSPPTLPISSTVFTPPSTVTSPSPPNHISPTQFDRPLLSFNSFDLESGNQTLIQVNNVHNDGPPDWKRIGKVVQTVGLGAVGVSVTLIVNAPASATTHRALYTAYLTVVCLGLFTGMGLSFFSVVVKGSPDVGWVQKRLIFFTLFFVAVACFLRLNLALPLAAIGFGTLSVFTCMVVIVLYLWFGRKSEHQLTESQPNRRALCHHCGDSGFEYMHPGVSMDIAFRRSTSTKIS